MRNTVKPAFRKKGSWDEQNLPLKRRLHNPMGIKTRYRKLTRVHKQWGNRPVKHHHILGREECLWNEAGHVFKVWQHYNWQCNCNDLLLVEVKRLKQSTLWKWFSYLWFRFKQLVITVLSDSHKPSAQDLILANFQHFTFLEYLRLGIIWNNTNVLCRHKTFHTHHFSWYNVIYTGSQIFL